MCKCDANGPYRNDAGISPYHVFIASTTQFNSGLGRFLELFSGQVLLGIYALFYSLRHSMRGDRLAVITEFNEENTSALKLQLSTAQSRLRKSEAQLKVLKKQYNAAAGELDTPRRPPSRGNSDNDEEDSCVEVVMCRMRKRKDLYFQSVILTCERISCLLRTQWSTVTLQSIDLFAQGSNFLGCDSLHFHNCGN